MMLGIVRTHAYIKLHADLYVASEAGYGKKAAHVWV